MKIKILVAFIAAPMIAFSGVALSHPHVDAPLPLMDTISFDGPACIVYIEDSSGSIIGLNGATGRLFVKFDVRNYTVSGNCTVTVFDGETVIETWVDDDFDCFVQITKGEHYHQILYAGDPAATTKKRFRNGKATLSCSGPYDPEQ